METTPPSFICKRTKNTRKYVKCAPECEMTMEKHYIKVL